MRGKTRIVTIFLFGLFLAFTINFFLLIYTELKAFLYHPEWVWLKNLQIYFLILLLFLILCIITRKDL